MTGPRQLGDEPAAFGREPLDDDLSDGVDHISFPPQMEFETYRVDPATTELTLPAVAPRRRRGLALGLVLGVVGGGAIGGWMILTGLPPRAPVAGVDFPVPAAAAQVQAQSLTIPAPSEKPAAPTREPAKSAAEPARTGRDQVDFDRLAKAILASAKPPAVNAPAIPDPPIAQVEAPRPAPALIAKAPPPAAAQVRVAPLAPPRPAREILRSDADVADADEKLALAYDRAMASAPDRAALHADQLRWLAERERLAADKTALLSAYQARIDDLIEQDRVERRKGGLRRLLRE